MSRMNDVKRKRMEDMGKPIPHSPNTSATLMGIAIFVATILGGVYLFVK